MPPVENYPASLARIDRSSIVKLERRGRLSLCQRKTLQSNVNEYAFRYNHRDDAQAMFQTAGQRIQRVRSGKLGKYARLG